MPKYICVLYFLFLATAVRAQKNKTSYNLSDYQHRIADQEHTIVFQLQASEVELKFTHPNKKYYWYSSNQIKITQGGYSGKLLNGSYNDFYFNKALKEQGTFKMGLKVGEWKKWSPQGTLVESANFKEGNLDGTFYRYGLLGEILEESNYKNGKMHGMVKRYIKPDSVVRVKYKNGIIKKTNPIWRKLWFKKKPKNTPIQTQ